MKLQQNEIEVLKQQILLQQRCLNSLQQPDVQQYEDEIIRLQNLLEQALLMPSEPKRNQLITYLTKIQELKTELQKLKQVTDNQQRDIQQLQNTIKKQQDSLIHNNEQNRGGRKQQENQEDWNQLEQQINQQMLEKERKIAELTANVNKASKNFQAKINQQSQFIEQLNAQILAKQNVMYLQLYLRKQLEEENENLKSELGYLEEQQRDSQAVIEQLQQQHAPQNNKNLSFSHVQLLFQYQQEVKKTVGIKVNNVILSQSSQTAQNAFTITSAQNQFFNYRILRKDCFSQYEQQLLIPLNNVQENQEQKQQVPLLEEKINSQNQFPLEKNIQQEPNREEVQKTEQLTQIVHDMADSYLQSFVDNYEELVSNEDEIIASEIAKEYLNSFISIDNEQDLIIKQIVDSYLEGILKNFS